MSNLQQRKYQYKTVNNKDDLGQSSCASNAYDGDTEQTPSKSDGIAMSQGIHEQKLPNEMMKKFHKSMKYSNYINALCVMRHGHCAHNQKKINKYVCSRCSRDKSVPKKFSAQNSMIPSPVPKELQGLTQFEEMLIALELSQLCMFTQNH